jgi:methyltransferase-like protein/2-polyprenyl-3-methyl-5-hydroxy-6-metoxy-1,4-benzoquinol methylase
MMSTRLQTTRPPVQRTSATSENTGNAYDQVPYKSYPYRQSHPARLATVATVLGLHPPDIDRCRVLELGCCTGGNLIPTAEQLPQASFVGVDSSSRQVNDANNDVEKIGLKNIRFRCMDIMDVQADLGEFDYIIAHGVYSWVPQPVQEKILKICKANLSPNGVAYVSYNTFPGWRMRGIIRDIMMYRARNFSDPTERLNRARHLIDFLAQSVSKEDNAYGVLLRKELELLQGKHDHYLLHDHLEVNNDPVYFHEFAARAQSNGLQYLAEADFESTCTKNFPQQVQTVLHSVSADIIELEQYMDFVRNRMFRQTLLCHDNVHVDREVKPERLLNLNIASGVKPEQPVGDVKNKEPVAFRGRSAVTKTTDPFMKTAFVTLGEIWPKSMSVSELIGTTNGKIDQKPSVVDSRVVTNDSMRLIEPLIRCFETGQVELSVRPSEYTTEVSERPLATDYARHQAKSSNTVTNLRHETVQLSDLQRHVVQHLDGTNDQAAIEQVILKLAKDGKIMVNHEGKPVKDEEKLKQLLSEPVKSALKKIASRLILRA